MKSVYDMLATYEQIKEIIEETEKTRHYLYRECLDNNWMGEIPSAVMDAKIDAYKQIEKLTKD